MLIREMGSTRHSRAWEAVDREGTRVAIKELKTRRIDKEPYLRFRDEVSFHRGGPHRGVLPVIGAEVPETPSEEQPAWLAMPIAETVREALGDAPTLDEVVGAVRAYATTLAALAEQGVHHRDLKPDNLFRLDHEWVVGDFGLVTWPGKSAATEPGQKLGPANFVAPEMVQDATQADAGPADVWSLAKVLWVLATEAAGKAPAHPCDPLRRHPHRLELARPQQPSQRASVQPIGLRPRLRDPRIPRETTMTRLTCGSSSRTISHELPVTSNATRSVGNRLSISVAMPSGVDGTRPVEYTLPSSQIAISMNSRCRSRPIQRPSGLSKLPITLLTTHPPIACSYSVGERRTSGRTTQTDSRSQGTRASRRGRHRISRALSPSSKPACPTAFSTTTIPCAR
jgi:serine/threonine protein kinase